MSDIGEQLDAAINKARQRAETREENARKEREEQERRRQESATVARGTILPALSEVTDEARNREHSAYTELDDEGAPASQHVSVIFKYWPGSSTLTRSDSRYEARLLIRDDGQMSVHMEKSTPSGSTSGIGMGPRGAHEAPATAEGAQAVALELMTMAIDEQIG